MSQCIDFIVLYFFVSSTDDRTCLCTIDCLIFLFMRMNWNVSSSRSKFTKVIALLYYRNVPHVAMPQSMVRTDNPELSWMSFCSGECETWCWFDPTNESRTIGHFFFTIEWMLIISTIFKMDFINLWILA